MEMRKPDKSEGRPSSDDTGSPLALDAEMMRRLGYRTVDMLVDRLSGRRAGRAVGGSGGAP